MLLVQQSNLVYSISIQGSPRIRRVSHGVIIVRSFSLKHYKKKNIRKTNEQLNIFFDFTQHRTRRKHVSYLMKCQLISDYWGIYWCFRPFLSLREELREAMTPEKIQAALNYSRVNFDPFQTVTSREGFPLHFTRQSRPEGFFLFRYF